MARHSGSYDNLVRGVSEQVPHDRLAGQHWEQVNFLSDPVRGLVRRRGSRLLHEERTAFLNDAPTREDIGAFEENSFFVGGREYSLLHRSGAKVPGSSALGLHCLDKQSASLLTLRGSPDEPTPLADLLAGGISSVAVVGQYVLMSLEGVPTTYTMDDPGATFKADHVLWVKGGAYSRTYTATLSADGVNYTATYTTPPSYYEGTLDTSDISATDTEYQKKVNDRVNEYNTAVNQHLASSSKAIQPDSIALALVAAMEAESFPATFTVRGAHILIQGGDALAGDDGGNGEFVKVVSQEIESTTDLTAYHVPGKVVKVTPRRDAGNTLSYYLQARLPDGGAGTGLQQVLWDEVAGERVNPGFLFLIGMVRDNDLYLATTPELLAAILGVTNPVKYEPSASGDLSTNPLPEFLGKPISHMLTFQDRLVIVAGSTVFMSRSGDYFNFFRESVLSLNDDDPFEMYAEGAEGDLITRSVKTDQNLILFGHRNQYLIGGREVLRPATAYCSVQSSYESANEAPPVATGNLVFFAQRRGERLTLQQMQTGSFADSYESYDVSTQLKQYLVGTPLQLLATTSPNQVFIRTKERTDGLMMFSYLDSLGQDNRLMDSWSRWEWAPVLGVLVGVTEYNGDLLTLTFREGEPGESWLCVDEFSRESVTDRSPLMDSRREYSQVGSVGLGTLAEDDSFTVIGPEHEPNYLVGVPVLEQDRLVNSNNQHAAVVGVPFTSEVTLTSPYIRDRFDKAILDARLVVSKLSVAVADSSAMNAVMETPDGDREVLSWVYRPVGQWQLGRIQQVEDASLTVPVLKSNRDYRMRLESRNWLPLTISSVEYTGQFFRSRG